MRSAPFMLPWRRQSFYKTKYTNGCRQGQPRQPQGWGRGPRGGREGLASCRLWSGGRAAARVRGYRASSPQRSRPGLGQWQGGGSSQAEVWGCREGLGGLGVASASWTVGIGQGTRGAGIFIILTQAPFTLLVFLQDRISLSLPRRKGTVAPLYRSGN